MQQRSGDSKQPVPAMMGVWPRRLVWVLGVLGVLAILATACRRTVWVENYFLSSKIKPGWVVVVTSDPHAPPLKEGWFSRYVVVPESGYASTSSPIDHSLLLRRYFLVDGRGRRTRLDTERQIFIPSALIIDQGSCHVAAITFWYGPKSAIAGSASSLLERNHPECPSGVQAKEVATRQ